MGCCSIILSAEARSEGRIPQSKMLLTAAMIHSAEAAPSRAARIDIDCMAPDVVYLTVGDVENGTAENKPGGKWRNSFGGRRVGDKLAFLRTGKFTLACENSAFPDYVTEKIVHAFAAHTIPIYWGAPNVAEDFNPEAFIDCSRFPSLEAVAEEVRRLDSDPTAYEAMLGAPVFKEGRCPEAFREERLRAFFEPIVSRPPEESRRRCRQARAEILWERARVSAPLVSQRLPALGHALRLICSKRYRSACRKVGD